MSGTHSSSLFTPVSFVIAGVLLAIVVVTVAVFHTPPSAQAKGVTPEPEYRLEVSDVQVEGFTRICVLTDRITGAQYVCWSDYRGAAMARLPDREKP